MKENEITTRIWGENPTLYPLQMLTQTMQINGESIVPLVEMARVCYSGSVNVDNYTIYKNNRNLYAIQIGNTIFGYDAEVCSFVSICLGGSAGCQAVIRQWDLFCLLLKYRIDFLRLAESGRAVLF